jgi:hypothetical protein
VRGLARGSDLDAQEVYAWVEHPQQEGVHRAGVLEGEDEDEGLVHEVVGLRAAQFEREVGGGRQGE